MELSKTNQLILDAYFLGYRAINGMVYGPEKKKVRIYPSQKGGTYLYFRHRNYNTPLIPIHRFVAYQKYKDKIFDTTIEVRHLDGDSLNNTESNIALGTHSQNMFDKLEKTRTNQSITAANNLRRFTDEEMKQIREDYKIMRSYKDVMSLWNISSKGTLHYILNTNYSTTK